RRRGRAARPPARGAAAGGLRGASVQPAAGRARPRPPPQGRQRVVDNPGMAAAALPATFPLGSVRRVAVTLLFAAAVVIGSLLGVLMAFRSDLPQVSSLEDFQPNIITQVYA